MNAKHWLIGLSLCLFVLGASRAFGGAPGGNAVQSFIPNVCDGGPNDGLACDPTVDECQGFECVPDIIDRPVLRGVLTLIADEEVSTNDPGEDPPRENPPLRFDRPAVTVLLEIKRGSQTFVFVETFQAGQDGVFPGIGNWNEIFDEAEIDLVETTGHLQKPGGALADLGAALRDAADQLIFGDKFDLSGLTPVFADVSAAKSPAIDEHAGFDGLGQVARFQVKVKFVQE